MLHTHSCKTSFERVQNDPLFPSKDNSNLVTLNVYASKVCLKFADGKGATDSSPYPSFCTIPPSPSDSPTSSSGSSSMKDLTSVAQQKSCQRLLDVSNYTCDCNQTLQETKKPQNALLLCLSYSWF